MNAFLLARLNELQTSRDILEESLRIISTELGLDGGWAWLIDGGGSAFYLAATHRLPEGLSARRDLLGGECWCLQRYLEEELVAPDNVSEIKCSRLERLAESAGQLRYHATVPLRHGGRGFGLLNFLHADSRILTEEDLARLQEVGKHVSAALWRADNFGKAEEKGWNAGRKALLERLERLWSAGNEDAREQLGRLVTDAVATVPATPPKNLNYPHDPLTERETEVLQEIARGLTNREIGARLYISERTVKFHVSAILSKLDAGNRTQAARIARKRGLLD